MSVKKSEARESQLMKVLQEKGRITVAEAVALLNISEATARRLFAQMVASRRAIRSYGGLQLPISLDGYSFERYEKVLAAEKRRIGAAAAALVENGDSLYLDSGTTLLRMAEALAERIREGQVSALNIVTNSLANLMALSDSSGCRGILLGGEYNRERRDFSGAVTEKSLEMFHFRKCFLGSEGFSLKQGFSANHLALAVLNEKVIRQTDQCFVLMDSSKFAHEALVAYAPLSAVDAVVTDACPEPALPDQLAEQGVRLLTVSKEHNNL